MYLDISGFKVEAGIRKESSFSSKHTGSSLRRLEVQTIISGQHRNEEFLSLIGEAKTEGVTSVDDEGKVISKWRIENTSWSYTQGTPIYRHTLEIEEVEELNLDHLVVGGLTIQPYEYEEEFDQDVLIIKAKVLLSEAQHVELKPMIESRDYFQVVRHGINEQPGEMRFGICCWSKHDEGIKLDLLLVDRQFDETPRPLGMSWWLEPIRNQVVENKGSIDALLNMLLDRGVLTTADIEHIHADAIERRWDTLHEFFRVEEIDEL